ncbi:acetyl-CoA synthetase-like protein [Trametes coccinea BRFM310]|uniref:Acetyl-CoA synthetase-like protein n=1 Tax=Trametes coccinea (strain BRFM310) TaxID=1353009 RepID=A0A1Y2IHW3_TRAC3|nr:acetyl-CoA synthetase-like protein [Trametes coccinea BRFM310]
MTTQSDRLKIKTLQGAHSTTWTRPPFYGPMTIPELYAFHAEKSPEHPAFAYDDEHGEVHHLQYQEVFSAIRKAASFVARHVPPPKDDGKDSILGVLAVADPIMLLALYVGAMYLGHAVFPLSVRNSAVAVAHLARRTSLHHLFVSHDPAMQRLAHEAKDILKKEGYEIELVPLPEYRDLYNNNKEGLDIQMVTQNDEKTCLILHSSGSTSFPKPVPFPHRHLTRWGFLLSFGDFDLCGSHFSMQSLPLFHIMGCINLTMAVCTGTIICLFRPASPPIVSTPDTVLQAMVAANCEFLVCVPAMLEAWSRNAEAVECLKKLKCILYAGAPLSKEVGDKLREEGLNIMTGFGSTEIGANVRMMIDPTKVLKNDWEYFSFSPPVEFIRVYQEGLPRAFEPVIVDSPTWSPNVFNTQMDGRPAYATSDLFEEHPTNPNLYKVYGRIDDQIALSTGEKTNPVPLEAILLQDPHVHAAIIFGQGRVQNGVIVQPKEPFDPSDDAKLEEFRNKIWPTIERVNNFAPSHSRIFKEMITVTKPDKPFQYTAKGTPRRHVSLAEYAQEIDELYRRVEESSQVDIPPPSAWEGEALLQYVREVVKRVLKATQIGDNDDLFQQGCDSLQATWIRNTILNAVRKTTMLSTHNIPLSFVYANPTIAALTAYLTGLVSGKGIDQRAQYAKRLEEMKELVAKYTKDWPAPQWKTATDGHAKPTPSGATIVLTGSTGRVGSHLLSQMLQKTEIARIYALNRESTGDPANLAERQRKAFETWGLDPDLLSSEKLSFHPTDLDKPQFGLSQETHTEIQRSVTGILHNAWRVDFNVTLPSYEPLIAGARNLIDFALGSPLPGGPSLLFVSSVASMTNYSSDVPVPEVLDLGPELALGTGYGESKWVSEQIFHRAAQDTGAKATVVRVGQVCGDTRVGGWSTTEWVPAIVRVSKLLKCIPAADDTLSWVPVDVAATTLLEFLHGHEPVLHLASPRPAAWQDVFGPLAEELGVPLVPVSEWADKLRKSAQEAIDGTLKGHFSAHNLVPFFEAALSRKEVKLSTETAVKVSPALANMKPVGREDAKKWVEFWQGVGFL